MTPALIHIFFHGLIAFIHNRPENGMMSAYALKEHDHRTILTFKLRQGLTCPSEGFGHTSCSSDGAWCACDIKDLVDISFKTDAVKSSKVFEKPAGARPFAESKASDTSWLVQMSIVNHDKGKAKKFEDIKDYVRAQMRFGWRDATVCALDQVPEKGCEGDDCRYEIYPNRFASDVSSLEGHIQALAEHVRFEVKFNEAPSYLIIKQRGGEEKEIRLDLGCSTGTCQDLLFVNDSCGDTCEKIEAFQGIGSHFGEYYELAQPEPHEKLVKRFPVRLSDDSVPLVTKEKKQLSTCSPDLFVERYEIARRKGKSRNYGHEQSEKVICPENVFDILDAITIRGFQTRVICPMAVFEN